MKLNKFDAYANIISSTSLLSFDPIQLPHQPFHSLSSALPLAHASSLRIAQNTKSIISFVGKTIHNLQQCVHVRMCRWENPDVFDARTKHHTSSRT